MSNAAADSWDNASSEHAISGKPEAPFRVALFALPFEKNSRPFTGIFF